ncbi:MULTISPECIES: hypothetical protein [Streptosporangium]|uniref:Flagellar motility protein MotE (MotC chaperone) n=1 Tax=Streptosporangium brasiliense TaxID=47480 RepID=A0ABT9RM11_9ACTN|nr:hypothetical protein [Streptosporangium brasiliense]MDP9870333.1 flagellar motility protein MotE (MotC chaperone) [Streptosporangium brasiliense]
MTRTIKPGEIIGHGKRGPIYLIAGGSEEHTPTPAAPAAPVPGEQYFTAAQVEQIRAEEKGKLYGKLTKQEELLNELRGKVDTFAEREAEIQRAEQARQAAEAEAARKAAEEEMSVRQLLQTERAEWNSKFAALEAERQAEKAALEKEREFSALQAYVQRRVREEQQGETIAPELLDLVDGSTPDEVERRIAVLREKTSSIITNMQAAAGSVAPPAPPRGVSPAGYAATGPMDIDSVQKMITPEELRQMSMADYAKIRHQLIGQAAQPNSNQGLFG